MAHITFIRTKTLHCGFSYIWLLVQNFPGTYASYMKYTIDWFKTIGSPPLWEMSGLFLFCIRTPRAPLYLFNLTTAQWARARSSVAPAIWNSLLMPLCLTEPPSHLKSQLKLVFSPLPVLHFSLCCLLCNSAVYMKAALPNIIVLSLVWMICKPVKFH